MGGTPYIIVVSHRYAVVEVQTTFWANIRGEVMQELGTYVHNKDDQQM